MSTSEKLGSLNAPQRRAVTYGEPLPGGKGFRSGPLLIVAGAGTGKTNTLAHRVAHLAMSGVDPARILMLTFTRRAALEMTRRYLPSFLTASVVTLVLSCLSMALAIAGLGKWVDDGGVFDSAVMQSDELAFPEVVGIIVHGINGSIVVPVIALVFLIVSFFARLPGVEFFNRYGPTEATISVTSWRCRPQPDVAPPERSGTSSRCRPCPESRAGRRAIAT